MESNKDLVKVKKCFFSLQKEKKWLQVQAMKGLKLKDIVMGVHYIFERTEPEKLVYEIDRFDIPNNPSLSQIEQKEDFLDMASEMGWEEITHDEDMNYYLCKKYEDGGVNELYNDTESRQIHATKYRDRYRNLNKLFINLMMMVSVICLLIILMPDKSSKFSSFTRCYIVFTLIYDVFCLGVMLIGNYLGDFYYNELLLSEEEWGKLNSYNKSETKIIRKLIFRNSTLRKLLETQSKDGWHLSKMGVLKYSFIKGDGDSVSYVLDSKQITNKRLNAQGKKKISDSKDLNNIGNDWQIESVKFAKNEGLKYVTAYKNDIIVYKTYNTNYLINGQPAVGVFLNKFGVILCVSALVGGVIGFVMAML